MSMEQWWNDDEEKLEVDGKKTCPLPTFSTKTFTQTGQESNPGLRLKTSN
jgi:hypothetical protein